MPRTKEEVMWFVAMLDLVNARLSIIEDEIDGGSDAEK